MDAAKRTSKCVPHALLISITNLHLQGLVTAAQKLNRKGIVTKYKKEIDVAYSN